MPSGGDHQCADNSRQSGVRFEQGFIGKRKFQQQLFTGVNMAEKISNMKDLVTYQEGSIVSKEIIRKPTGTVTIFAFDQDQGLSEHTAPFDALVCILDGEVEISISGESHHLKSGEMIIMPGGKPHALKALKRFKMMLAMVRS